MISKNLLIVKFLKVGWNSHFCSSLRYFMDSFDAFGIWVCKVHQVWNRFHQFNRSNNNMIVVQLPKLSRTNDQHGSNWLPTLMDRPITPVMLGNCITRIRVLHIISCRRKNKENHLLLCWICKFFNYIGQVPNDVSQLPRTHTLVVLLQRYQS